MKLNKYQLAWIKKLMSGTTRKAKNQLFKSNRACCLGVGLQVCGLDKKSDHINDGGLAECNLTKEALGIDEEGTFLIESISKKWKEEMFKENIPSTNGYSLAGLNDYTNWSHVKIGKFINENRKALFSEST